jgi:hypothetical protein
MALHRYRKIGYTVINEYGGDMGETYGVPVEEIQEGIRQWGAQG